MSGKTEREILLDTAKQYTLVDRNTVSGDPEDNFVTIADFWRTYSKRRWGLEIPFHPVDVANMMTLLKVSRIANNPQHWDSYVDVAGYAACGAEVAMRYPDYPSIPVEAALAYAKPHVEQAIEDLDDALEGCGLTD